jgi:hypothetical protein
MRIPAKTSPPRLPPLPQGAQESDIERFPLAIQRSASRRRWSTRYTMAKLRQETMKGHYALISGIDDAIGALRKDLHPTLQELVGLASPAGTQGSSLITSLKGAAP